MRLTPAQIDTIKSTAQAMLGEGVQASSFDHNKTFQMITMQSLQSF